MCIGYASVSRAEVLKTRTVTVGEQTFYVVKLVFPRGGATSLLFGFNFMHIHPKVLHLNEVSRPLVWETLLVVGSHQKRPPGIQAVPTEPSCQLEPIARIERQGTICVEVLQCPSLVAT
jgi:hypothetical protein